MFIFTLTLTLFISLSSARTCYHPDKSVATNNVPCTSADTTYCCDSDAICMSNGYCVGVGAQPYVFFRGSCTDENWGSGCPTQCVNKNPSGGAPIIGIGTDSSGDAQYCCGFQVKNNGSSECVDGDTAFTLNNGEMILGRAALENVTEVSNASSTSTTTVPTETVLATSATCSSSEKHCSSNATAVGAGVGVPLGVLAVSAVVWALWERSRRITASTAAAPNVQEGFYMDKGLVQESYVPHRMQQAPTELDTRARISEMMGSSYQHAF